MDPTKESPRGESLSKKEVLIPKETASALGRGLNQLLGVPLEQIKPYIDNLKSNPQVNQDDVQAMSTSINNALGILDKLEHAKDVKIIPFMGGFDFDFSEERITKGQTFTKSEITIDDTTTPTLEQLTDAVQHNFNNSFVPLIAYAGMIEKSTNDPRAKQQVAEIASRSQSMLSDLNPIQTEEHQLTISMDATGTTTITPTKRSLVGQKT